MPNTYALIVGVSEPKSDSGLGKLPAVINDIYNVENYCKYALSPFRIKVLSNKIATLKNILIEFDNIFNNCTKDDFVFIYFSGHGDANRFGAFFLPYFYRKGTAVNEYNAVAISSILQRAQAVKPDKLFIFLDICDSGSAINESIGKLEMGSNIAIYCSSYAHQPSRTSGKVGLSLATYCFLQSLCSESQISDELPINEIFVKTDQLIAKEAISGRFYQKPSHYYYSKSSFSLPTILRHESNLGFFCTRDIFHSIAENNVFEFKQYIKDNANLNTQDTSGNYPLHAAAQSNDLVLLKLAIEHGATIDIANRFGQTALHIATSCNNLKCARYLIKNGADVEAKDNGGNIPLISAIIHDNCHLLQVVINSNEFSNYCKQTTNNILHLSCLSCSPANFLTIISMFANDIVSNYAFDMLNSLVNNEKANETICVFLTYLSEQDIKIKEYSHLWLDGNLCGWLSRQHIDYINQCVDLCNPMVFVDVFLYGLILSAISDNRLDLINKLKSYVDMLSSAEVMSLLSESLREGKIDFIEAILSEKNCIFCYDYNLNTLLHHHSLLTWPTTSIQYLLKNGLDINQKNIYGQTPLHLVFDTNNCPIYGYKELETFKYLLDCGADIYSKDRFNLTPILLAEQNRQYSNFYKICIEKSN